MASRADEFRPIYSASSPPHGPHSLRGLVSAATRRTALTHTSKVGLLALCALIIAEAATHVREGIALVFAAEIHTMVLTGPLQIRVASGKIARRDS